MATDEENLKTLMTHPYYRAAAEKAGLFESDAVLAQKYRVWQAEQLLNEFKAAEAERQADLQDE
jgi:hypothetical protein